MSKTKADNITIEYHHKLDSSLFTLASTEKNTAFYEKMGFVPIPRLTGDEVYCVEDYVPSFGEV